MFNIPEPDADDLDAFIREVCAVREEYTTSLRRLRPESVTPISNSKAMKETFSITRAIQSAANSITTRSRNPGKPTGYEGDVCKYVESLLPDGTIKGFALPLSCLATKTLGATNFAQGAALADAAVFDPFDVLRAESVVARAGAMIMQNVKASLTFPGASAGSTAQWLSQIGSIPESNPTFQGLHLSPHRLGAMTKYTNELLSQTNGAVEDWTRRDLLAAVASAIDAGSLKGAGGVEPTGLASDPDTKTIVFAGSPTYERAAEMEFLVTDANAPESNLCFIGSPAVRKQWRLTPRATPSESSRLWENDNTVCGHPAFATKNAPGNRMICGAFNHYAVAVFGILDVLVNPYTEDATGTIRVTINAFADCGAIYPTSFCVSTDAATQ